VFVTFSLLNTLIKYFQVWLGANQTLLQENAQPLHTNVRSNEGSVRYRITYNELFLLRVSSHSLEMANKR